MSNPYESRFWKKSWDPGLKDLDPKEFEITFAELVRNMFDKYPDNMALAYQGLEISFGELDKFLN